MALAIGAKLSLVVVKQISKPIATFVKQEVKAHPILAPPLATAGRFTHRLSINLGRVVTGKPWLSNASVQTMAPLTQQHAVDMGADLLGESIIFGIVGGTVAFELYRQNRVKQLSEFKAQEKERLQWESLRIGTLERDELRRDLALLKAKVDELQLECHQSKGASWLWRR